MNLKDLLPKKFTARAKKSQAEYFFALNITPNVITAALWGVLDQKLDIVRSAQIEYTTEEDLVESANRVIDEALADFEIEPTKVLFGVPDSWLHEDNLKDEYMKTLKEITKGVDLSPLAYVSSSFALAHLQQKQNGVPLTSILVDLASLLSVTVVKAGKIVGTKTVQLSSEVAMDVEKALLTFTDIEVLPSKILVFSSYLPTDKLEAYKDEMQSFGWMNNLPFLHMPKLEVLPQTVEIEALCLSGASELDPTLNYHPSEFEHIILPTIKAKSGSPSLPMPAKIDSSDNLTSSNKGLAEMGFVAGDVKELDDENEEVETDQSMVTPETAENLQAEEMFDHEDDYPTAPVSVGRRQSGGLPRPPFSSASRNSAPNILEKIISLPTMLLGIFHRDESSGQARGMGRSGIGSGLILNKFFLIGIFVLGAAASSYILLPKAKITIFIDQKVLENQAEVVADPSITQVDEAGKKIPGKIVETDESGSDTGQATGKKKIGSPAKGKVALINQTTSPKTFPSGTILTASNGISYKTDSAVTATSSATIPFQGTTFGKAYTTATAMEIGPEGNLAALKGLTVKGESASNYTAQVAEDLTGGTSQDVTVVTADDQKKLLATVTSTLRKKAQDDLQGKLTGDMKILQEALAETIGKTVYSKGVNDQASDFTLNLSVHYKGTAYSENDLKLIVSKLVQTTVPDGYELNLNDTETQSDVLKLEKDNKLVFSAKFKAKLMPKMDLEKLKQELRGKTPAEVAELVRRNNDTVIGSEVKTSLILPNPLLRTPLLTKNISIEVIAK
ncbi:hypothetical protein A2631_04470 [Candidatus Daviesbacteria bacterium RIFCSPHIGHO2_01_FULL_44_29]|uniref:Baseplate protein J-like domain-containing protein n=1 Tax=Candidatus Daviesbacteria bacterium RIFCSPHIGHO2_02_FULL_43_12 TaxID=1797776 RepID=A0A1F5KGC2_9BACT|nr:MAG: hypothetical protein A2631_04470 [Candidatus Daviesbacteria bacterium RIFCSPHIGHO2_01_FULL_44_29]OGE39632.1 MAG: hypothetical protein A3E86_03445 [Candidatus Daviesbacteria bacterium RIFCSPHIGHO2_12_FULL_47_45]OGE39977.1 MAG: hypothetical protein A3D25_04200 [Candidatus Daviesbacteria bacterium RIFCSPHIGHO2_02_FULL_43_12]OGE70342.1 MAG: hypothetical protein A3B55_01370 [Candidatus Daviesbacteria bacterium RIFCSPLOWO2_01_FULL_43_15]